MTTTTHECPYCGKRYVCQSEPCRAGLYWACAECHSTAPILRDVPPSWLHQTSERTDAL